LARYNVKYKGKWACFSSVVDGFITKFTEKSKYEEWRLQEYGRANYEPAEQCNMMSMAEAVYSRRLNHTEKEVIDDLVKAGISHSEAISLLSKANIEHE
jgi:hypothetical protein